MMARSAFEMVDVGAKAPTRRRALARGALQMSRAAFSLLLKGRLPKGDALRLAEAAGIMAAKRASETIPLCHPLPLEQAKVWFEPDAARAELRAFCEAVATAKTGVEMEALAGASGALLCVYDLVKQVDPALTISEIRLEWKEGGRSGLWRHPRADRTLPPSLSLPLKGGGKGGSEPLFLGKAAVVTVSDRRSRGAAKDLSGPLAVQGLKRMGFRCSRPRVVADDAEAIKRSIRSLAKSHDLVLLTGGTGLSSRDVTPEAVMSLCDRLVPGVGEALRAAGAAKTPFSYLSRSVAGQMGHAFVMALPGSASGVADGLEVLSRLLPHALHVMRGGDHAA